MIFFLIENCYKSFEYHSVNPYNGSTPKRNVVHSSLHIRIILAESLENLSSRFPIMSETKRVERSARGSKFRIKKAEGI